MWVVKGACLIIGTYAIFKLGGVGIEWMREGLNAIRPPSKKKNKNKKNEDY